MVRLASSLQTIKCAACTAHMAAFYNTLAAWITVQSATKSGSFACPRATNHALETTTTRHLKLLSCFDNCTLLKVSEALQGYGLHSIRLPAGTNDSRPLLEHQLDLVSLLLLNAACGGHWLHPLFVDGCTDAVQSGVMRNDALYEQTWTCTLDMLQVRLCAAA